MAVQGVLLLVTVLCLVHSVYPQCEDFLQTPPSEVAILEGGEESLFCLHETQAISWFQAETEIRDGDPPESCSCLATFVEGVAGGNLTFFNFSASSSGQYSCRATTNDNLLHVCGFNVSAGVIPSVSIEREAIDETTLTIFPAIDFGNPRASVSWLFDGEILDPTTNRITISDEGVLIVTNFAEGPYTVLVSNTYGAVNATIDIIIPPVDVTTSNTIATVPTSSQGATQPTISTSSSKCTCVASLILMVVVVVAAFILF